MSACLCMCVRVSVSIYGPSLSKAQFVHHLHCVSVCACCLSTMGAYSALINLYQSAWVGGIPTYAAFAQVLPLADRFFQEFDQHHDQAQKQMHTAQPKDDILIPVRPRVVRRILRPIPNARTAMLRTVASTVPWYTRGGGFHGRVTMWQS
jgi:hypothetical protein